MGPKSAGIRKISVWEMLETDFFPLEVYENPGGFFRKTSQIGANYQEKLKVFLVKFDF